MKQLIITAFTVWILFAGKCLAQWDATSFVAIPDTGSSPHNIIYNNFSRYIDEAFYSTGEGQVTYEKIDEARLKSGAFAALTEVLRHASYDAKKLANANFPKPKIVPILTSWEGDARIPIFWQSFPDDSADALASYYCRYFGDHSIININSSLVPYERLNDAWNGGVPRRTEMTSQMSWAITHELIHAIQANTNSGRSCDDNDVWISEGIASGLASYLLQKREPKSLKNYHWARNERSYANPLYTNDAITVYGSGSFFRYLVESTEVHGVSDLRIARNLTTQLDVSDHRSRVSLLRGVDRVVKNFSDSRELSVVLAEFFTELASYKSRYDRSNDEVWIWSAFSSCEEFQMQPGVPFTRSFSIRRNAARCIKVEWEGFQEPKALQIYLEGEGVDQGSLHMGQSVVSQSNSFQRCYDITSKIDNRLAKPAEQKCMMRRGATKYSADGVASTVNGWTSDFNLEGSGFAFLILTNAAKNIWESTPSDVTITMSGTRAKDEEGVSLPPRKKVTTPVKDGRTLMDSRVHALAGGPGRLLIDGRSVSGGGLDDGFLDGSPGAGEIDGAAIVVRTGEYNVILVKDKTGVPNGGAIMREPDGSFSGAITTLGMKGMPEFPSCGFKIPAELTIQEQTKEQLSFRVSGDVFNMSRETMSGQGSMCDRLRSAHVEFKAIDVSLPWSANYDGTATIERAYPPMQDIYDEKEFRSGPSFGGIATSRSIVFGDDVPDDLDTDETEQTSSPTGPTQSTISSTLPLSCTCLCPGFVHPTTEPCLAKCEPVLRQCSAPNILADTLSTTDAETNLYYDLLGSRNIPDEIRDILTSDFRTMSPETRRQIIRESAWEQAE